MPVLLFAQVDAGILHMVFRYLGLVLAGRQWRSHARPAAPAWRRWLACVAALLGLVLPGLAGAGQVLRIVTIDSAPFGFRTPEGRETGMMYDIGNLIAAEAGLESTNVIVPYQRSALALVSGQADMALRYTNAELAAGAIPVGRVLSLPTIVVAPAGKRLNSLGDLHGKLVAVPRGGQFDTAFDAQQQIRKYEVADYPQMLRMLRLGRVDAGIGSSVGIYYNAQQLGIARDALSKPLVLGVRHFELHLSRKAATPELIERLSGAIARLQARNEIRKVVDQYLRGYDWKLE
jgi:ABC-type amino acid transport substrate-binding protein